jgi:hypothetical protein
MATNYQHLYCDEAKQKKRSIHVYPLDTLNLFVTKNPECSRKRPRHVGHPEQRFAN